MKHLSQRDRRWSSKLMGLSKWSLGRQGCTTTCISMLSDYFGSYMSPLKLASNVNNYTNRGLIIWGRLKIEKMSFVWREYGFKSKNIMSALNDPDRAVILEVNNGAHWVVAVKRNVFRRSDFIIIDPWDGKKKSLLRTYRNITGAAYFKRKDVPMVPEPEKKNENYEIKSKFIKSALLGQNAVYIYNGKTRFPIPSWPTFVLLFGEEASKEIELVPDGIIKQIPTGIIIPNMD